MGVRARWKACTNDPSSPAPAMINAVPTGAATADGTEPVPMTASSTEPDPERAQVDQRRRCDHARSVVAGLLSVCHVVDTVHYSSCVDAVH